MSVASLTLHRYAGCKLTSHDRGSSVSSLHTGTRAYFVAAILLRIHLLVWRCDKNCKTLPDVCMYKQLGDTRPESLTKSCAKERMYVPLLHAM